ncbi:MAG TPA: glycosyltransferase [Solirubrobacterales bacterium]|nr:glycosyltransferase [Solirubrobacterales bacterium]
MPRPKVSVIVPFRGDARGASRLLESFALLQLGLGDEIVVADNSEEARFLEGSRVRVVRATRERSSYYARNAGAAAAVGGEWRLTTGRRESATTRDESERWLLFTDSDCVPVPSLIDAYFAETPADDVGALAGSVFSDPDQRHFLARYATDRGFLDQEAGVHTAHDAAATANLMVRRAAFEEIGGFTEGIRSGGDVDLCRRLIEAGWKIDRRPDAVVTHLHRESLPDLMRAISRYASGAKWLDERYPGTAPAWPLVPGLVHCGKDIAGDLAQRRFEEAAFRGVDALGMFAHTIGYRRSNVAN